MADKEDSKSEEKTRENIERDAVFHYSREHRLEKASPDVIAMNDGKMIRPSLSKTLFATRANRLVFVVIVVFFVFALGIRFASRAEDKGMKFGGNILGLTIEKEEEVLILGIVKQAPKSGEIYIGEVDIAVSPVTPKPKEGEEAEIAPTFTHRITFNPLDTETYHLSLPFEGKDFIVMLRGRDEQRSVRLRVK